MVPITFNNTNIMYTHFIKKYLCHSDGPSGEVGVVVLALAQQHAGGRVRVARQQREDVVLAALAAQHYQRQVRRVRAYDISTVN